MYTSLWEVRIIHPVPDICYLAVLNGAGEFVVEDFNEDIERTYNPALGLNCYDFTK